MLHITNGESVSLPDAGLGGAVVYWKDVLHEGPVPSLPLEELSPVRAEFISRAFGGSGDNARADFEQRDAALRGFRNHDEVILWFEHDLYDQLQLIQILDYLADKPLGTTQLSLVQADTYLGHMRPDQLAALFSTRHTVTPDELEAAARAWTAFCSPDPGALAVMAASDNTPALPFLNAALRRHLEQFPSLRDGLNRTERQILRVVANGAASIRDAFLADQKLENSIFMGDSVYALYIHGLTDCREPLLRLAADRGLGLTTVGEAVLSGGADYVELNDIDRWLGGVHLSRPENVWRWDGARVTR